MLKKLLWVPVVLVVVLLALAVTAGPDILLSANGYAAKWVCSNVFLGERAPEQAAADLPPNPLTKWLDVEVDPEARTASAGLGGRFARRAAFRDGLGCTLIPPGTSRADLTPVDLGNPPPAPKDTETPTPPDDATPVLRRAETDPAELTRLAEAVATAFEEDDPEKLKKTRAVVVVRDGQILAERYAEGFSETTRLPGWSMTKSVLNALFGRAAALGLLEVEQTPPVPEWRGEDPRAEITFDQLLRMSSGLDFSESYINLASDVIKMLFLAPNSGAVAAAAKLGAPPDSHWSYSSGTTNVLSRALRERLGKARYDRFARHELFAPLGMESAVLEPDPSGVFVASSFGWATARDWARFGLLYLQDGVWQGERLLPEGWVAYTRTPTPAAPRGNYGAHFWLNAGEPGRPENRSWPAVPQDTYWASGYDGQYVVIVPSRDCVIVRLGLSQTSGAWRMGDFVASVLAALPD